MNIVINYLKKRKKQVRLNIYFARMMMSDFKKQRYKRELQEINRALFLLSSVVDKENQKEAIIELMRCSERLGMYNYR